MGAKKIDFYTNPVLLEIMKKSGIFVDSKYFVDMSLKEEFTPMILRELAENQDDPKEFQKIIQKYFNPPPSLGLQSTIFHDWKTTKVPKFIETINDPEYKIWAQHLSSIWEDLVRKIPLEVKTNPDRYSLIYLKEPFVVPGGRFREMYYWDTYWSIIGLLHSEIFHIAKGTIRNLLSLVKRYGFVPNGNRKYYTNRSQPPFLTLMVRRYFETTQDLKFVEEAIPTLLKEYEFWMKHRTTVVRTSSNTFTLNQYKAVSNTPRPESFKEDFNIMHKTGCCDNKKKQKHVYSNIVSAAESGWDFSSRYKPYLSF